MVLRNKPNISAEDPLEKVIEKKIKSYASKHGWTSRKFNSPQRRAAPDQLFCAQGLCFFIEFKRLGKEPTPLQVQEHKILRSKGNIVYVCDNIVAGHKIIDIETLRMKHFQALLLLL